MKYANRPGMRPTLGGQPDHAGRGLRRAPILDGTIKVAYGPGQAPNSMPLAHYPDDDHDFPRYGYDPPTDWPPAGSLLRPPQVVWLGCYFPFLDSTATGDFPALTLGNVADSIFGIAPEFHYEGHFVLADSYTQVARGHPSGAERARLLSAFEAAKARVESLRPGRTFVAVLDWHADAAHDRYMVGGNWFHLTCPPVGWGFYGTDFLHVHCGHFGVDLDQWGDIYRSGWSSFTGLAGNTPHRESVARVHANAEKFAGFAVRIFTYDESAAAGWGTPLPAYAGAFHGPVGDLRVMDQPAAIALINATGADAFARGIPFGQAYIEDVGAALLETGEGTHFGSSINFYFVPPDWPRDRDGRPSPNVAVTVGGLNSLSDYQGVRRNASIAEMNGRPAAEAASAVATYEESISVLNADGGDYDVSLAGDTVGLDADALVRLIADHFGFDPNTGKDLPPSQLG